jgi:hypothetical protein
MCVWERGREGWGGREARGGESHDDRRTHTYVRHGLSVTIRGPWTHAPQPSQAGCMRAHRRFPSSQIKAQAHRRTGAQAQAHRHMH